MLGGFVLPWMVTPASGITLNAYDLGEWASLMPAVQAETPALLTAFVLRLGLLWIASAIASLHGSRLLRAVMIGLIVVAMLPPFEILSNSGDPNYRQLLFLAFISLLLSCFLVWRNPDDRLRAWLLVITGGAAAISSLAGGLRMESLFRGYDLAAKLGGGVLIYAVGGLWLVASGWILRNHSIGKKTGLRDQALSSFGDGAVPPS